MSHSWLCKSSAIARTWYHLTQVLLMPSQWFTGVFKTCLLFGDGLLMLRVWLAHSFVVVLQLLEWGTLAPSKFAQSFVIFLLFCHGILVNPISVDGSLVVSRPIS